MKVCLSFFCCKIPFKPYYISHVSYQKILYSNNFMSHKNVIEIECDDLHFIVVAEIIVVIV